MAKENRRDRWCDWLSPLKLTLLAINAVCFGGCLVLLAAGKADGPLVLLTVAVGLMLLAGLTGALIASRRRHTRSVSDTE